ncbi:MAG TPA: nitrile hydratase subunit beta [Terriglobia bacterium]|nr:nitrile hydratase subunit beta [Terriglobia bacterium]
MNGIHDMGGMQDMGGVRYEKNEPVFHERWEGRVFAMYLAGGAWGKWTLDAARYERELIPPADYLRMSYYEKWLDGLMELLVKRGLLSEKEAESGTPEAKSQKATPPLTAGMVLPMLAKGHPARRDVAVVSNFQVGEKVRARNINPVTHTRLPRYARGKVGIVERDQGVFVFPDTNALYLGEKPQHVYSVRFAARELWGDAAQPRDAVYIDLWDDYLERA